MIWNGYPVIEQIHIHEFYSFFDIHYEKGFHFAGETHNFWECVYVMDGSICVSGDERVYNMEKNHIIFHKPLELHKLQVEQEEGTTLLIFSFSMEGSLEEYLKDKVFKLTDAQQHIMRSLLEYLHSTLEKCAEVSEVREHKYLVHERATKLYFQMLSTYVSQLLLSLIDHGQISETSTEPDAQIFRNAVNYINHCIDIQVSVDEIAGACYTSVSSLKRIFQKYAGISIHKYALMLKIKAATELLHQGMSVTQAAEALGFSSQAYFSACYKRETGLSPTDVRKKEKY